MKKKITTLAHSSGKFVSRSLAAKLLFVALLCGMASSAKAEEHYLVGGATDSGWEIGSYHRIGVAMMKISSDTWVWYGKLTTADGDDGRFKIPNSIDGWGGYWAPSQDFVLSSDWSDLSENDSGDNKFKVSEEGYYKVTINTSTKKIKAEKLTNEPSKDGDYYLIGSVADFCWFAAYIASDETNASKARLTANLDFSTDGFFPLASDKHKFKGEIDGAGHTVSGINVVEDYGFTALVRYATDGAYIHDLVIEGSFSGGRKVAGVIGFARDGGEVKLTNVINKANVTATGGSNGDEGNAAGLVACATDDTIITAKNCGNMGSVWGQSGQFAAFAGWTQDKDNGTKKTTFTNCWNSGALGITDHSLQSYDDSGTTKYYNLYRNPGAVTATNCYDASSGDNNYGQGKRLGTDKVTSGDLCNSLTTHTWSCWGFCALCDAFNDTWMTPVDGCYEIGTKEQLNWFSYYVNNKSNSINGKLTADIDFSDQSAMIGAPGHAYGGTFDGQGHIVTIGFNVTENECALFRRVNSGTIKNLKVDGTIVTTGQFAGGIVSGIWERALIENCVADVTITDGTSGDRTHGGIVARISFKNDITIRNCAFTGTITASDATGCGGILGWPDDASNEVKIENCLMAGTLTLATEGNNDVIVRSTALVTNCYYSNLQSMNNTKYATPLTAEQLSSGEACFLLNGKQSADSKWFQTIGTDAQPSPLTTGIVYANGNFACDGITAAEGASVSFLNTNTGRTVAEHSYTDGICTVCRDLQSYEGVYQIGCADALNRFSEVVNQVTGFSDAVLTKDIDMTGKSGSFTPIGQPSHDYFGHFNGQNHKIEKLTLSDNTKDNRALFGQIAGTATIENVILDATCSIQGHEFVAGILARVWGDSTIVRNCVNEAAIEGNGSCVGGIVASTNKQLTIQGCLNKGIVTGGGDFVGGILGRVYANGVVVRECGNEGAVTATGNNAAGIVGCSGNEVHINNCYNTAAITGAKENAGICAWMGSTSSEMNNCYSTGIVSKTADSDGGNPSKPLYRYNNSLASFENNFFLNDINSGLGTKQTSEEFQNGTVFVALHDYNANNVDGSVWQMEFSGTPHPVLYDADIVYKDNFPNRPVAKENAEVKVMRSFVKENWNTVCLPFGMTSAQIATVFGTGAKVAALTGCVGTTLKFTTDDGIIEAGKPYLVYPTKDNFSEFTISDVNVAGSTITSIEQGGLTFMGTLQPTEVFNATDYGMTSGNLIKKVNDGTIKGFRAFFRTTTTGGARATSFTIDDETTGIITLDGEVIENGKMYNLGGQRVSEPQCGLYIVNGKKVIK